MKNKLFITTLCVASIMATSAHSFPLQNANNSTQNSISKPEVKKKLPFNIGNWLKNRNNKGKPVPKEVAREIAKECLNGDKIKVCRLLLLAEKINSEGLIQAEQDVIVAVTEVNTIRERLTSTVDEAKTAARTMQDLYDNLPRGEETSPEHTEAVTLYNNKLTEIEGILLERDAVVNKVDAYIKKIKNLRIDPKKKK
jgi:hypothetical protein